MDLAKRSICRDASTRNRKGFLKQRYWKRKGSYACVDDIGVPSSEETRT